MTTACIIPVRGGSKGLPRKNLAPLVNGISLLEWTIDQAKRCYPASDVIVSTEDLEMMGVASIRGANVLERPAHLALDETSTADVVKHLLDVADPTSSRFQYISILQVTSPLREDRDVLRGRELIEKQPFDSVLGVCELVGPHPAKMYFLDSGAATPVAPDLEFRRRQDLPRVLRRNGAIFMVTREHFERTGRLWGGRTGLVEMNLERSVDIDSEMDLDRARLYLQQAGFDKSTIAG